MLVLAHWDLGDINSGPDPSPCPFGHGFPAGP